MRDDKLGELVGNAVGDPVYQVQTLLVGQTGNNRDHELVLVFRQPKFFLESQLCLLFLFLRQLLFISAWSMRGHSQRPPQSHGQSVATE